MKKGSMETNIQLLKGDVTTREGGKGPKYLLLLFLRDALTSCFWLIVPIILWDLLFASQLPRLLSMEVFWRNIPPVIAYSENIFRYILILFPLLMPLRVRSSSQKVGLIIYAFGLLAYFSSWLALMLLPGSAWSTSVAGLLAPAYTPLIWAVGIALVGDSLYVRVPYRPWFYIVVAVLFTIFHVSHTMIVITRGV
jgi:hypothetical protein